LDNVAQVAFQQDAGTFNPAAEPPAQIFSQPLAKASSDFVPVAKRPAAPSSKSSKFVVPDPLPEVKASITSVAPAAVTNSRREPSQRIMLVTDSSPAVESKTIAQFNKTETKPKLTFVEKIVDSNPTPLLPAAVATVAPAQKQAPVKTAVKANNAWPKVDASLQGEVYTKSVSPPTLHPVASPKPTEQRQTQQAEVKTELPLIQLPQIRDIRPE